MKKFIILMIMIAAISGLFANANILQDHYRWRNDDGDEANATWIAAEDTSINILTDASIRIRFDLANTTTTAGGISNTNLQYSLDESTWLDVTTDGSVNHFALELSDNFADGDDATSDLLTNQTNTTTQVAGKMYETTINFGGTFPASTGFEYEWCIKPTANVTNAYYYFRLMGTPSGGSSPNFFSAQSAELIYGTIPTFNPPQNLSVTDVGYATWDAPASRALTGYNVYLDGVFDSYTTDLFYNFDDGNLVDGQTYTVGITAVYDFPGESVLVTDTFVYDSPILETATNLSVNTAAYATWEVPATDTPDGYNVYLDNTFIALTTDLFYDLDSGLNDGQLYIAEITAVYGVNESDPIGDTFTYGTPPAADYTLISVIDGGNPGNVNTDLDNSTTGWIEIAPPSQPANVWSDVASLPADFDFLFFGQSVSDFKISQNGLLTFDIYAADPPPNTNVNLPSTTVPDLSIALFWDDFTLSPPTGSNDRIYMKTFGTAPNRQVWVKYASFEYSTYSSYANFACCLEETTNKVFVVDYNYIGGNTGSATIGLQYDSTTAVEHAESPNYTMITGGSAIENNDYHEFTPLPIQTITIPADDQTEISFGNVNTTVQFTTTHIATDLQITETPSEPSIVGVLPSGIVNLANTFWNVESSAGDVGTYDITFDLSGVSGIDDFSTLSFLKRDDDASAWVNVEDIPGVTVLRNDPLFKILGLTSFSDFVPAGGDDNPLPVILSSFYALYISGTPTLYWTTQSEINNAYWNVYRGTSDNFVEAALLNANNPVPGNGTTNSSSDYIYVDIMPVMQNTTYWYWIEDVSADGETEVHFPINLSIPFEDTPITPGSYGLHQNYPNPFNPSTAISFALAEDSSVKLTIYNVKGKKIRTLFNDHIVADQIQTIVWDGKDTTGKQVSSGVYFYKLITETKEYQKKMLLVK